MGRSSCDRAEKKRAFQGGCVQGNAMFRKCVKFNMTHKNSSQRGRGRKESEKDEGHEAEGLEHGRPRGFY